MFSSYYNWLKYTLLPPSFFFKNRFFIERNFKYKFLFSEINLTFKNTSWLNFANTTLSTYYNLYLYEKRLWYLFFFILFIFLYFVYFQKTWLLPDVAVIQLIYYLIWRVLDILYFWLIHTIYILIIFIGTFIFNCINFILPESVNLNRTLVKYFLKSSFFTNIDKPSPVSKVTTFKWISRDENIDMFKKIFFSNSLTKDTYALFIKRFFFFNKTITISNELTLPSQFYLTNKVYNNIFFYKQFDFSKKLQKPTNPFMIFSNIKPNKIYFSNTFMTLSQYSYFFYLKYQEKQYFKNLKTFNWLFLYNNITSSDFIINNRLTDFISNNAITFKNCKRVINFRTTSSNIFFSKNYLNFNIKNLNLNYNLPLQRHYFMLNSTLQKTLLNFKLPNTKSILFNSPSSYYTSNCFYRNWFFYFKNYFIQKPTELYYSEVLQSNVKLYQPNLLFFNKLDLFAFFHITQNTNQFYDYYPSLFHYEMFFQSDMFFGDHDAIVPRLRVYYNF